MSAAAEVGAPARARSGALAPLAPWLALRIVLGASLGMFINLGPVLVYTFGVFLKPIADDTGWARTAISAALGPATLVVGLTGPLFGAQLDRYGPRRFVAVSATLFALGLAALGAMPSGAVSFAVLLVLATVLGSGMTPLPFSFVVSGWFDARRGLALGIALSMSGVAVATLPPLAALLIAQFGWRQTYLLLAGMVLGIGLPSALWLVRDPPNLARTEAGSEAAAYCGLTLRQAVAARTFWLLAFGLFAITVAVGAGTVHLPALLADRGVPAPRAAFIMSVVGAAMIAGRIGVGALLDRVFGPRVAAFVFLTPVLGHVLLARGAAGGNAIAAAALFGLGLGAELDVFPYLASRAFGIRHFGKILGALMIAFSAGLAVGPAMIGLSFAKFGRYDEALWFAAVAAACAASSMLFFRRNDFPFAGQPAR